MASSSTLATAVRQATAFDRGALAPSAGLLAAIPVAAVVAVCTALGQPVAAVTTGVGAMLVGVAWRATGGRPPLGVLATDTGLMALSTFGGCLTGRVLWLHVVFLAVWSFLGGLLVALGPRPGVVGFQAILAAVAFGRFDHPVGPALALAGLVAAGGAAQVGFLALVRWPTPLAAQRRGTARALCALAELAAGPPRTTPGVPAGAALDEAADALAAGALLGAPAVAVLRNLVTDGHRLRVGLTALHGLAGQLPADAEPARAIHAIAVDAGWALREAADLIEHPDTAPASELRTVVHRVSVAIDELERAPTADGVDAGLWTALVHHLAAVGGQLRTLVTLTLDAVDAGRQGRRGRRRRWHPRANRPLGRRRAGLPGLVANLSLDSPATRHAIRLAVAVSLAGLLVRVLPVHRGYWVVIAAAAVLRPEFGATFTRGVERAGGTVLGVMIAGLIAAAVHPGSWATVAIVGGLAYGAYATFQASYAVGFAWVTALTVFLINTVVPDTYATASARLLDTLIGGVLGLLLFAAWPTWARRSAQAALAELVLAERRYGLAVLSAIAAGGPPPADAAALSRAARLARTRAEADVARSLAEPAGRRIDARVGTGALGELRRVIRAIHVLRLEAEEDPERDPVPELAPLVHLLGVQLAAIGRALETDDLALRSEPADLRDALRRFAQTTAGADLRRPPGLLPALDELVDAVNATTELVAPASG